jgi:hypothetical protein
VSRQAVKNTAKPRMSGVVMGGRVRELGGGGKGRSAEEAPQARGQHRPVPQLAFPQHQRAPARGVEGGERRPVPRPVAAVLGRPEGGVGPGQARAARAPASKRQIRMSSILKNLSLIVSENRDFS